MRNPELVVGRAVRPARARQVLLDQRALVYEGGERLLRIALHLGRQFPPDDRADTGQSRRQRDVPEPAGRERDAQDVAGIRFRQPVAALEVAEEGQVLEKW